MKIRIIYILLLFFLNLHAQSDLVWQNYNIDNGLPQNSVKDIINDKYGFIWIATENGITRFDGSQFVTMNLPYNKKRYRNFFGCIEKDSIFNVEEDGKAAAFITGRKLIEKPVFTKYLKTSVTFNKHQYLLYNKNSVLLKIEKNSRYFIYLDKDVYFFENNLITYYNPLTNTTKPIKISFNIMQMKNIFLHGNTIFIADQRSRKTVKLNKGEISGIESNSMYTDAQSNLYWSQGTQQAYVIYRDSLFMSNYCDNKLSLKKIAHIPNFNKQLRSLYINAIVYSKENQSIFLGSLTKGLYILTVPQFSTPRKKNVFTDNVFYATYPFDDHSVITPEGNIYDSTRIVNSRNAVIEDLNYAYDKYSLASNTAKDLFFIKNYILYKRLKSSGYKKCIPVPLNEQIDAVYSKDGLLFVVYIKNDKYYLAQYDDSLRKIRPLFYFTYPVNDIKKYNGNQLLIGSLNGLYIGDTAHKKIFRLSPYPIKKIIQTSDCNIWILTKNHGFFLLRNNTLIAMPLDENAYLLDPHTLLEDSAGNFWISSNNGLFKVKKQNLLQFADHRNQPIGYYRYTIADGLPTNEFNGGGNPNGNKLTNGQMVFPSLEGLVFFTPEKIKSFYVKPDMFFIERAQVDNREITFDHNILHIPNNDFSTLEIYLDFPYFKNLNNIDLHVLPAPKAGWKDMGIHRKFSLGKLSPGDHLIQFRYLDRNNTYVYKNITIKVGYLYYQSLLFKAIIVLASILAAYIVFRFNSKQLKYKNELLMKANTEINAQKQEINSSHVIREKLIEAISHDIATPIKHLSHLSRKLKETDSLEIQKKYFNSIHKSSELLYHFTLELGNYAFLFSNTVEESVPFPLSELLEEKKDFFENIAQENNTSIEFISTDEIYIRTNKSVVAAIIHNIIDNAVKNTTDGKIQIEMADDDTSVYIKVSDNGTGMPEDLMYYYNNLHAIVIEDVKLQKKGSGYGLKFVLLLIDKISSQISFKKNIPKGTNVEITIPKT
ncbi:hypothetical protein KB553_09765 [Chryseobacterium rhizoplanae]|uniref:sensor histidine kinase n=1 Tax=Chryseobacterium rhizoplanae TaxID=1609531 RepID=UPI001CE30B3E|nr:ATP-binding protein [Chryseobacterium rhizoplanae]UCA61793.1 hypothetical protein KB553_09765 [Chryseobacterium rhizoplanae]